MTNPKGKILFLVAGLMLGIVIGGSIMYWAGVRQNGSFLSDFLNAMIKPFETNHEVRLYETFNLNKDGESNLKQPTLEKAKNINTSEADSLNGQANDSIELPENLNEKQSIEEPESINNNPSNIQIPADTDPKIHFVEDFFLMTDKLLATRTFVMKDLNPQKPRNSTEKLDSLIGNPPTRTNGIDNTYLVEFWESPINYRGYKMGRNRIVVYGIYLPDFVSLKQLNKNVFMKYLNDYYALDFTNEFKPLRVLKNESLIQELNAE